MKEKINCILDGLIELAKFSTWPNQTIIDNLHVLKTMQEKYDMELLDVLKILQSNYVDKRSTALSRVTFFDMVSNLYHTVKKDPSQKWEDAFCKEQILSKKEIVRMLPKVNEILIIGGWVSPLPSMLTTVMPLKRIISIDIDNVQESSDSINKNLANNNWLFKAVKADALSIEYKEKMSFYTKNSKGEKATVNIKPDIIINTICEHIDAEKWWSLIPKGQKVIVQSNDFFGLKDHINCVVDIDELKDQCPMEEIYDESTLELENYERYTVFGSKN